MSEPVADPGPVDVVRLREGPATWPWIFRDGEVVNHAALLNDVFGRLYRLEAKLDALETLVREIRHALSAGAVGKWAP